MFVVDLQISMGPPFGLVMEGYHTYQLKLLTVQQGLQKSSQTQIAFEDLQPGSTGQDQKVVYFVVGSF